MDTNERLVKVEVNVAQHAQRISHVENKVASLHADLTDLKRILLNIRWWLVGVGSFYMLEQVGFVETVKKLLSAAM